MTLLKRSQEAGLAVNPSMAKRLTEDCCREREYYENRKGYLRERHYSRHAGF